MKLPPLHTLLLLLVAAAPATQPQTLIPGVQYFTKPHQNSPGILHIITIDLQNPSLSLRVVPSNDPPKDAGRWQTTLLPVAAVADREKFVAAVNGDFFESETAKTDDLSALAGARVSGGAAGGAMGSAVTDGRVWASDEERRVALLVDVGGRVRMERVGRPPTGVWQMVAGSGFLVEAGKVIPPAGGERNALTAVGMDRDGTTLMLVVSDGLWMQGERDDDARVRRGPGGAGCYNAINLDGGGSSTAVIRDPADGRTRVVNHPTDGKPRPVAQVLGVSVKAAR